MNLRLYAEPFGGVVFRGHGFDMIANEIAAHEEVKNLYLMSGAYDLAVIVQGKSLRNVSRFVSEKISTYDTFLSRWAVTKRLCHLQTFS